MSWVKLANDGDVHKTYVRAVDAQLLPPRVGHNWNDQAFRACHDVPQQLEGEWRGTRAFVATPHAQGNRDGKDNDEDSSGAAPMTETTFGRSAQQLLAAWAAASSTSRRARGRRTGDEDDASARAMTLDDKILRFYAFFRERVPEGELYDYWYRYVELFFYLADDTVHIYEPHVPNSGLDGGVFLRRQRVKRDARQRERHPAEAYLTANDLVVGESVRIHGIEFFLYDCDAATRALLTALGAHVADAVPCPVNVRSGGVASAAATTALAHTMTGARYGNSATTRAPAALDSGKVLRFHGVLRERHGGGGDDDDDKQQQQQQQQHKTKRVGNVIVDDADNIRYLDLLLYVDDGSMAVVERHGEGDAQSSSSSGGCGSHVFLSRCWLPKSGSLAPLSALTFAHRVNGQRAPDLGCPDAYYTAADLDMGVTVNVLGRRVLLYDCDTFTRRFYAERYGVALAPALDAVRRTSKAANGNGLRMTATAAAAAASAAPTVTTTTTTSAAAHKPRDVLRFFLRLAQPRNAAEHCRRFTLAYYTDTGECTVYESAVPANSGYTPGCLARRQRLRKPQPPVRFASFAVPSGAPASTASDADAYYTEDDLRVGKQIVVGGLCMRIGSMDAHTTAYLAGDKADTRASAAAAASPSYVDHLLSELLEYLGSRYRTAVAAFLAFDHDRDGVIGVAEFAASLRRFQITDDAALARRLFARIASPAPPPPAAAVTGLAPSATTTTAADAVPQDTATILTTHDLMTWMSGTTATAANNGGGGAAVGDDDAGAQTRALAARALRVRALTRLRERLEARCMTCTDMFRLASTMPRAYRSDDDGSCSGSSSNNVHTLCNVRRDAVITPVQLRRCVHEVLGGAMPDDELRCVLAFFYPRLSPDEAVSRVCDAEDVGAAGAGDAAATTTAAAITVDLPQFQRRFQDMCALAQLSSGGSDGTDKRTTRL